MGNSPFVSYLVKHAAGDIFILAWNTFTNCLFSDTAGGLCWMQQSWNVHAAKSVYLEEILYQHHNMTWPMVHETLWNMRILAAQRGWNAKNGPFVGNILCCFHTGADFQKFPLSSLPEPLEQQQRWDEAPVKIAIKTFRLRKKSFFWWYVITQWHRCKTCIWKPHLYFFCNEKQYSMWNLKCQWVSCELLCKDLGDYIKLTDLCSCVGLDLPQSTTLE